MKDIVLDGVITGASDWIEHQRSVEGKWTVAVKLREGDRTLCFWVDTETVRQISVGSEVEVVIRPKAKP